MRRLRRVGSLVTLVTALAAAAACGAGAAVPSAVHAEVARVPPMGWSSWSFVRQDPTEQKIEAQAKALVTSGLIMHGYREVNLDDFYYLNPATEVDPYGRWVVDRTKFPDGIAAVADYVRGLGEKFGIYLTPGIPVAAYQRNTPIAGTIFHARDIVSDTSRFETNYNFGSGSMYFIDYRKNPVAAQAFLNSWADELAGWGVDYVKLDGIDDSNIAELQHWSMALKQTGRTIYLGLSNGNGLPAEGTWRDYANAWRIEHDVECYCSTTSYPLTEWSNVALRFTDVPNWLKYAGSGGWNDLDSIEIGNGADDGLTPVERQTQFTLWAISAAPLLLGTDLTHLDSADRTLLTNDEVIAVDQHGRPAHPLSQRTPAQVWVAANGDGTYTVALFNLGNAATTVSVDWSELGFGGSATARDLWSHTDLGAMTGFSATVAAHGSRLLRVTPVSG